jgi:hypothetical protein
MESKSPRRSGLNCGIEVVKTPPTAVSGTSALGRWRTSSPLHFPSLSEHCPRHLAVQDRLIILFRTLITNSDTDGFEEEIHEAGRTQRPGVYAWGIQWDASLKGPARERCQ